MSNNFGNTGISGNPNIGLVGSGMIERREVGWAERLLAGALSGRV